jgi:hypothetical protein
VELPQEIHTHLYRQAIIHAKDEMIKSLNHARKWTNLKGNSICRKITSLKLKTIRIPNFSYYLWIYSFFLKGVLYVFWKMSSLSLIQVATLLIHYFTTSIIAFLTSCYFPSHFPHNSLMIFCFCSLILFWKFAKISLNS